MPRLPGWVWLLLAAVFAALAAYLAHGRLKGLTAQKPAAIHVVVAKNAVGPDTLLTPDHLMLEVWGKEKPPQDFFSKVEDVAGKRETKTALKPGNRIMRENTTEKRGGLAAMISPGHRAMTVKVTEDSGVAGFLTPGDRVDVMLVMDKGDWAKDPITKTLLKNIKILGVGQKTVTGSDYKPQIVSTVTLEVTPEQAERLALAAVEGRISLALRSKPSVETIPPVSVRLSPGQRAITVKMDETLGFPSSLTPGDRVDVMLVMDKGEWAKYPFAKTIFQDLQVLDTGKRPQVTLAVTPQQAVDLTWAAQAGRISLALRDQGDQLPVKTRRLSDARWLVDDMRTPPAREVQLIRGIEWEGNVPLDNQTQPVSPAAGAVKR